MRVGFHVTWTMKDAEDADAAKDSIEGTISLL
jgi:hypothetical protein